MSVLAQLERLDRRVTGMPETEYVFVARAFRLRVAVIVLLTLVSLAIALASNAPAAGWLLVVFAVTTGVKTVLAQRALRAAVPAAPAGRWHER